MTLTTNNAQFRHVLALLPMAGDAQHCVVKVTDPDLAVGIVQWCPVNPFLGLGAIVELFENPDEPLPVIGAWQVSQ